MLRSCTADASYCLLPVPLLPHLFLLPYMAQHERAVQQQRSEDPMEDPSIMSTSRASLAIALCAVNSILNNSLAQAGVPGGASCCRRGRCLCRFLRLLRGAALQHCTIAAAPPHPTLHWSNFSFKSVGFPVLGSDLLCVLMCVCVCVCVREQAHVSDVVVELAGKVGHYIFISTNSTYMCVPTHVPIAACPLAGRVHVLEKVRVHVHH